MQLECMKMLKKGGWWEDVHEHAHKVAIKGLLNLGVLKGGEGEIFEKRVSVAFFPHGLGHYLGMDTHDTGGNPDYGDRDTMFRYLRVRGKLPTGAVITVEPGVSIYFVLCGWSDGIIGMTSGYLAGPKLTNSITGIFLPL